MRVYHIILMLLISCNYKTEHSKNSDTNFIDQKGGGVVSQKNIWKQYKREKYQLDDTLPFPNCYITIDSITYRYYIADTLSIIDTLIKDNQYLYPVFIFKNNIHDKLFFLRYDSSEIVLKHFGNEGEYEYFRKEK